MILVVLNRISQLVVIALTVATLTFLVTWFGPGDIATQVAIARYDLDRVTPELIQSVRVQEGLDRSGFYQFSKWIGRTITLDLGSSLVTGQGVGSILAYHFSHTVKLALVAMVFSLAMALPLGIAGGIRPESRFNRILQAISSLLVSIPPYILAVLLILVFGVYLSILPVAGFSRPEHVILPALTLGLGLFAMSNRIIAASVNTVRSAGYYAFARTKGLPRYQVLVRHGLRNASAPVLTFLGLQFAFLLDGVVIIENIFAWPGIGHLLLESIMARDIPVIQGAAMLIGAIYVTINTLVDLTLLWLNPVATDQP
ncbi:ABC transporter permease [Desulfonatronovibrio hydrogenovorans]|uniref:ABC transporter permease n=1 Tax=Desulfonatronovibrio hydrogenovorans TaxID=53245 RepID=UPI00048DABD7|nr:ABC transporter permease [Desulfonatronovibrio hydrogenovorans]